MPFDAIRGQLRQQSNTTTATTLPCYFSINPTPYANDYTNHYSYETPCSSPTLSSASFDTPSDPYNPLLAYRQNRPTSPSMSSSPMQLQTAASHGAHPSRPSPQPVQNVLHVTSDDSATSSSSSEDDSISSYDPMQSYSCLSTARCSRCQRTGSLDPQTGNSNMLQYGLNLWYCTRCAGIVGFRR